MALRSTLNCASDLIPERSSWRVGPAMNALPSLINRSSSAEIACAENRGLLNANDQTGVSTSTSKRAPVFLVVVAGIEIDFTEQIDGAHLSAPRNVLLQRLRDGRLLGRVSSDFQSVIQEILVNCEVGRHV